MDHGPSVGPLRIDIIMKTYFFWNPEIINSGGLDGPGAPETTPKGRVLRTPPFGMISGAPGAVQTSRIEDFWVPEQVFMIILIRSRGYRHRSRQA